MIYDTQTMSIAVNAPSVSQFSGATVSCHTAGECTLTMIIIFACCSCIRHVTDRVMEFSPNWA